LKVLFNNQEVAEVYFEYMNRHADTEQTEAECPLQFHTDLIRKSATQIMRSRRTPIWRGVTTLSFSVDKDIFKYEGIDAKEKNIVTVIIPFSQINSIQTYSRKGRVTKRKTQMQTLNPKELENWR